MTQADLLRYVVDAFKELGINYMISGSQASIFVIGTFATSSPYEMDRPVAGWLTTLRVARHAAASTP